MMDRLGYRGQEKEKRKELRNNERRKERKQNQNHKKINKTTNEKDTPDNNEIQRINRYYFEALCSNKLNTLK